MSAMGLLDASPDRKILVLGTALWGWGVDRPAAYHILERFLSLGGRFVDTATNYPINKRSEDFGLAAKWIAEWIELNDAKPLSVFVKVGARDNMGSSSINLTAENILKSMDFFRNSYGEALSAIAIHWDNRGDDEYDQDLIAETVEIMNRIHSTGLQIGFSGVRRPDLYLNALPCLSDKWWIQVKENVMSCAARMEYEKFFPKARYLAYGINMGGLKSESHSENSSLALRGIKCPCNLVEHLTEFITFDHGLQPSPQNLNELALLIAYFNSALSGVVIGPRSVEQLENTMRFWGRLKTESSPTMINQVKKFKMKILSTTNE